MILCAGLGTRLRPLTARLPKPACPVLDRPLVWYQLALLAGAGVQEVVVNTHQLPDAMAAAARAGGRHLGLSVEISHEPTVLGTGGGLKRMEAWLGGGTCLVLNGDILFDVDLPRALEAHRRSGAVATMVVRAMPKGADYRPVDADAFGRVLRIAGDGPAPAGSKPWLFTGVHLLEPEIFAGLPPVSRGASGLHEQGYRPLLERGRPVLVHEDAGAWSDLGTPARYLAANLDAASGAFPLRRFLRLGVHAVPPGASYLGPEARVDGELRASVVGAGAFIPAGAHVERSVVWAGTELRPGERLKGAIAADELRVVAA